MALKILSIGGATIDAYMDKHLKTVTPHITGSASNAAKNYAALGHLSKARIWIGKDSHGKQIVSNLIHSGVTTVFDAIPKMRTPHSIILQADKKNQLPLIESVEKLPETLKYKDINMIKSANWIHLGGLNCRPNSINRMFTEVFKETAIPVTWCPGEQQINDGIHSFHELLKHTVIMCCNKSELLKFTGRRSFEKAVTDVLHTGVKVLVVTNHDKIIQVISHHERFTVTPPHTNEVDHHGATDRFASTFTSYVMNTYDIPLAMQMATFHTGLLIEENGADTSLMSHEQLEAKFKRVKAKYLVHVHEYR